MMPKSLIVALVATGTVAAAGAGSYLAVRNTERAVAESAPAAVAPDAPPPATEPVTTATSVAVEPQPLAPVEREKIVAAPKPAPAPRRMADRQPPPDRRTSARAPVEASPAPGPVEAPLPATPPPVTPPPVADPIPPPAATPPPVETAPPAQEIKPRFDEVIVAEDSVIGIRLDAPISSETARVEDKVTARVSRDLTVDGRAAIPAGSRLEGTITAVERGGKFRERARIGVRFTSLVLGETRLPIQTETIFRDGESPAQESTSKIGASAVVGAILGAVVGGKKGAVIGGTAGAAGGTAAVMAGGRQEVTLAAGTPLNVRLTSPVTVLIERNERN